MVAPGFVPSLAGRTAERHRAEIRALAGFREATVAAAALLEDWLRSQVAAVGAVPDQFVALLQNRCRELGLEPPAADRVDRIVPAAIHAHDEQFCAGILGRLTPATRERLEALLRPAGNQSEDPPPDQASGMMPALLLWLRGDAGKPSLASIQDALAKLELIRDIRVPADLFDGVLPHELERYRRRVTSEAPYELRRHPQAARLTWLAAKIEEFHVLFLDRKNALIKDERQQRGTIDHTPVSPREVIKRALELGASALILVHNHPSGDPRPSEADIIVTKNIIKAAAPLGIIVHDHLIIGRGGHISLRDCGLILFEAKAASSGTGSSARRAALNESHSVD